MPGNGEFAERSLLLSGTNFLSGPHASGRDSVRASCHRQSSVRPSGRTAAMVTQACSLLNCDTPVQEPQTNVYGSFNEISQRSIRLLQ
jgi:hypothetical protein